MIYIFLPSKHQQCSLTLCFSTYTPGFWQLIKFAWVQYLAVLVVFWWVLSHVQSFVFENQIILTSQHNTNKLHKH